MYKQLILLDFAANKKFLLAAILANLFFFVFLGLREQSVDDFMATSLVIYWILIITCAVVGSAEKRLQLYAQLPVTAAQVSFAIWFSFLLWLGGMVCFWILFGLVFDPNFTYQRVPEIVSAALGIMFFIVLIAIAIDLGAFKPAYIQLLFLGLLAALFAVAVFLDISIGVIGNAEGFQVYPLALWSDGSSSIIISIIMVATLLLLDHLIYKNSDHYLR